MKKLLSYWILLFVVVSANGINIQEEHRETSWNIASAWYNDGDSLSAQKVDVFYVFSTEVAKARDAQGNILMQATLNAEDRKFITQELSFVKRHIFHDDFNFIAPFYHQLTFEALCGYSSEVTVAYPNVSAEICEAFDYYMQHINNGRPFILAGFSQGAMLMIDLLKHLTDEQYSQMVATYMIGYRLSADDLLHPHIHAAQSDNDRQVVVSFNSVASLEGIWNLVSSGAATCMNPVNWHTDNASAQFIYEGDTCVAHVDTLNQVLIVTSRHKERYEKWMKSNPLYSVANISPDNLHHWDLLFYTDQLHQNAVKRAYNH